MTDEEIKKQQEERQRKLEEEERARQLQIAQDAINNANTTTNLINTMIITGIL